MPIVSISLNDEILTQLDELQSSMGFSGRSEAIRAGIRAFIATEKQHANIDGDIHAILLVVHDDAFDDIVSGIRHSFEDLITTHLHSKIEQEKCMELFIVDGDGEKISMMTRNFQTNKNMDTVRLVLI